MSRRSLQWKERARQSGDVNKIIPTGAKGRGEWLTNVAYDLPNAPARGTGEGNQCTAPISTRKEQLVRQWAR